MFLTVPDVGEEVGVDLVNVELRVGVTSSAMVGMAVTLEAAARYTEKPS